MSKIQFDTVNGVVAVKEFDSDVMMIDEGNVFEALRDAEDGTVYAVEVSDATFDRISSEYGIH